MDVSLQCAFLWIIRGNVVKWDASPGGAGREDHGFAASDHGQDEVHAQRLEDLAPRAKDCG